MTYNGMASRPPFFKISAVICETIPSRVWPVGHTELHCFCILSDRLSAQDLLTIKKVKEYVYDRLYGDKGEDAGKEGRGGNIEITCAEQVQLYGDRGENIEITCGENRL